ncbi:3-isopropylmalate dehydratase small subunit [Acetomicrobium sp. S15 = DSM 107314]|jgi:3-isopropylmalate/(R)-2-methylmalate dehydratase small subunit|uniref:3-isopropylmalate dehydratase small subunit n=1 Tax=Acetomicrobium sp. S15 = DSM 107314 TaxID=2529858 RepID=UPI0018E15D6E|nr:3-isopropylmalate dehydratase small subunit [Acetomicrobium sp. S15 = DSM 107314]
MKIEGRVWKFGRDVDTDAVIPAKYLNLQDPKELGRHCMENIRPDFAKSAKPGDIVVAEENFGCGSSREHAPLALKGLGISCVIAKSFARIFFRNCVNIGLPILEAPEAVDAVGDGDELSVDLESGTIEDVTSGLKFKASPMPRLAKEIAEAGGLIEYAKQHLL